MSEILFFLLSHSKNLLIHFLDNRLPKEIYLHIFILYIQLSCISKRSVCILMLLRPFLIKTKNYSSSNFILFFFHLSLSLFLSICRQVFFSFFVSITSQVPTKEKKRDKKMNQKEIFTG